MAKKKRGSSMGTGTRKSRTNRKTGKKWLSIPKDVSLYKEEAETTIKMDFLPYVVTDIKKHPEKESMSDDVWYRFPYKIHGRVGPNRQAVLCPSTIGKPCPICDEMQAIYDDPDADNKQASKFRPSKRSLFVIKIKGGDKKNKGKMFIWDVSDFNFFDQVDNELEHGEEEWNDFACLEGGYTLKVRFIEKSFDETKFAKADRIDFIERDDYDEDILDETPCLDDVIIPNIKTLKEIEAVMDGEEPEEDEEETPKKEKKKPKKEKKEKKSKKEKKPKFKWEDISDLDEDDLIEFAEENLKDFDEDDFEDEDELREELVKQLDIKKPKKKEKKEKKPKKKKDKKKDKKNKNECPYAYKLGDDFEEKNECVDPEDDPDDCCKMYDECFKIYDKMQEE